MDEEKEIRFQKRKKVLDLIRAEVKTAEALGIRFNHCGDVWIPFSLFRGGDLKYLRPIKRIASLIDNLNLISWFPRRSGATIYRFGHNTPINDDVVRGYENTGEGDDFGPKQF